MMITAKTNGLGNIKADPLPLLLQRMPRERRDSQVEEKGRVVISFAHSLCLQRISQKSDELFQSADPTI
jgi:hypothetical protein